MSIEGNKEAVRAYLELYASGDLALADRIIAPGFVDHTRPDDAPGPEGVKRMVRVARTAFPDLGVTVERMIAEGDVVAFHFVLTGTHLGIIARIAPTGKRVTIAGMDFVRVRDGQLTDVWSVQDSLGWLLQVGAVRLTIGEEGA
jgi:steroid delta-isomerase-like uncharacterized protein